MLRRIPLDLCSVPLMSVVSWLEQSMLLPNVGLSPFVLSSHFLTLPRLIAVSLGLGRLNIATRFGTF